MPPLLQSFLSDLLTGLDCEKPTLVLDNAVTPDSVLLETVRRSEGAMKQAETKAVCRRSVLRHHSQPILPSNPWSSSSSQTPPSKGFSRWDSGASSSKFDGKNSDPQLIFPLRTCDDKRYNNPNNRTDRWSVSRYHSDSLISPQRSKEKLSLSSLSRQQHSKDDQFPVRTNLHPLVAAAAKPTPPHQAVNAEPQPEMEMTWRRSRPSIRRRSSFQSPKKQRRSSQPRMMQGMEIIWERKNPCVEKSPEEKNKTSVVAASSKTLGESCSSQQRTTSKPRTCPSLLVSSGKSTMALLETAVLLICDSFPPKVVEDFHDDNNVWDCSFTEDPFTILNFCGGDIAPACRQLEYVMTMTTTTSEAS